MSRTKALLLLAYGQAAGGIAFWAGTRLWSDPAGSALQLLGAACLLLASHLRAGQAGFELGQRLPPTAQPVNNTDE